MRPELDDDFLVFGEQAAGKRHARQAYRRDRPVQARTRRQASLGAAPRVRRAWRRCPGAAEHGAVGAGGAVLRGGRDSASPIMSSSSSMNGSGRVDPEVAGQRSGDGVDLVHEEGLPPSERKSMRATPRTSARARRAGAASAQPIGELGGRSGGKLARGAGHALSAHVLVGVAEDLRAAVVERSGRSTAENCASGQVRRRRSGRKVRPIGLDDRPARRWGLASQPGPARCRGRRRPRPRSTSRRSGASRCTGPRTRWRRTALAQRLTCERRAGRPLRHAGEGSLSIPSGGPGHARAPCRRLPARSRTACSVPSSPGPP